MNQFGQRPIAELEALHASVDLELLRLANKCLADFEKCRTKEGIRIIADDYSRKAHTLLENVPERSLEDFEECISMHKMEAMDQLPEMAPLCRAGEELHALPPEMRTERVPPYDSLEEEINCEA